MEFKHIMILLAGIFANYVAACKIIENERLKKENEMLKQKLGIEKSSNKKHLKIFRKIFSYAKS